MNPKPDFYKQTIEKDEEALAESVLTPLDISTNDKKELEIRREITNSQLEFVSKHVGFLHMEDMLKNDVISVIEKDLSLTSVLGEKVDSYEKINTLLRRFNSGAPLLGTYILLSDVLITSEKNFYKDSSHAVHLKQSYNDYMDRFIQRGKNKWFKQGDLVTVEQTPRADSATNYFGFKTQGNNSSWMYFSEYTKERNKVFPRGLNGIVVGNEAPIFHQNGKTFSYDLIMVKFCYGKEEKWSIPWELPQEYSPIKRDVGAYDPKELDFIGLTRIEQKSLERLVDGVKGLLDGNDYKYIRRRLESNEEF